MLHSTKNKFWLENPLILVSNPDIIPLVGMNTCSQMNAMTRFVFILFIILILFNFDIKFGFLFLIISLLIIIILYYIQRKTMERYKIEHFTQNIEKTPNLHKNPPVKNNLTVFASDCLYCNGECGQDVSIEKNFNNPNYVSRNQKLVGPANPKTKIAPVIAPPLADLSYWRANNLVDHSSVNKLSNVELYQSGYVVTEQTPEIDLSKRKIEPYKCLQNSIQKNTSTRVEVLLPPKPVIKQNVNAPPPTTRIENKNSVDIINTPVIENYTYGEDIIEPFIVPNSNIEPRNCVRDLSSPPSGQAGLFVNPQRGQGIACNDNDQSCRLPEPDNPNMPSSRLCYPPDKGGNPTGPFPPSSFINQVRRANTSGFRFQRGRPENLLNRAEKISDGTQILANQPGWVNTLCGYNPKQLIDADLPTNLSVGNCTKNPILKDYNREIFTQTIEPNIFTSNQINEPINSNIGISFAQQFPPMSCKTEGPNEEDTMFLQRDPRIIVNDPDLKELCPPDEINQANIYDPRFTGYGTGYRSYIDETTGQPRFYYDDIDAITKPNYIVRSKIDNQVFADKYGPIEAGNRQGNIFTPEIRALADTAFKEDTLQFRNELQARISRKINRKMWQRKAAPINTKTCGMGMYGL